MNLREYFLVKRAYDRCVDLITACPFVGVEKKRIDAIRRRARALMDQLAIQLSEWDVTLMGKERKEK